MNLDLEGKQPWRVGEVMHVTNRLNHPTAGIMRIDGREASFRCIAGHGGAESLWAYAWRPERGPVDTYSPRHLFEQWASHEPVIVVVASEDKGILRSEEVSLMGHSYSELVGLATDSLHLSGDEIDALGFAD